VKEEGEGIYAIDLKKGPVIDEISIGMKQLKINYKIDEREPKERTKSLAISYLFD
jgi:hypothetical protein